MVSYFNKTSNHIKTWCKLPPLFQYFIIFPGNSWRVRLSDQLGSAVAVDTWHYYWQTVVTLSFYLNMMKVTQITSLIIEEKCALDKNNLITQSRATDNLTWHWVKRNWSKQIDNLATETWFWFCSYFYQTSEVSQQFHYWILLRTSMYL